MDSGAWPGLFFVLFCVNLGVSKSEVLSKDGVLNFAPVKSE